MNQLIIAQIINILLIYCNIAYIHNAIIGVILGGMFLSVNAYFWGIFLAKTALKRIFRGNLLIILFIIISGGTIYFFYALNNVAIILLLILIAAASIFINNKFQESGRQQIIHEIARDIRQFFQAGLKLDAILSIFYLILIAACFIFIMQGTTDESIVSPWHVVSKYLFIIYSLATLLLIGIVHRAKTKFNLVLISIHYFFSFSIALFVYKMGYGYDPFIHQATEKHIFDNGFITPKPFYYLGQYSIVVFLAKILQIKVEFIDSVLLLLLSSAYLPSIISNAYSKCFATAKTVYISTIIFLSLPFSFLINGTPYNLSVLFCLMSAFLSLNYLKNGRRATLYLIYFLTAAALVTHPLGGIPALILALLLTFKDNKKIIKIIFLAGSLAFPLLFCALRLISGFGIKITLLKNPLTNIGLFLPNTADFFQPVKNFIYGFGFNTYIIILIFALFGLFLLGKKFKIKNSSIYILSSVAVFINFFIIDNFILFNDLISYERADFANRLLNIAFLLLLPPMIYALTFIFNKIMNSNKLFAKAFIILLFACLIATSLYLSYPRKDDIAASTGWSVSSNDFRAAEIIKKDAGANDYVVLANQSASAAALKSYGFSHYYNGQFYYPIPTNSELYAIYYLMASQKPSLELIQKARELTGVQLTYFIIPNYWSNAGAISDIAAKLSNEQFNVNDKIRIFKFN